MVPCIATLRSPNVATPPDAFTVTVPARTAPAVPVPLVMARVPALPLQRAFGVFLLLVALSLLLI